MLLHLGGGGGGGKEMSVYIGVGGMHIISKYSYECDCVTRQLCGVVGGRMCA